MEGWDNQKGSMFYKREEPQQSTHSNVASGVKIKVHCFQTGINFLASLEEAWKIASKFYSLGELQV